MDTLTPIPEDVSVAASGDVHNPATPRSIADLSTASAVASSDSGGYGIEVGITTGPANGGGRGKKRRQQGPGGSTNAAIGGAGGDGDNVSDTHASLGGADGAAAAAAAAAASGGTTSRDPRRRREEAKKKPWSSADLSWLLKCTKKSMIFYSIVLVLLIVIAVGIYFIVDNVGGSSGDPNESNDGDTNSTIIPEGSPTPDPQFPSFDFMESEFPTSSPSYNHGDVMATDAALLQVDGTTETNLYDPSTPEGMSRYWLIHIDQEDLRVDEVGETRIQQRYIACVLYYATNGANWTGVSNYLNPTLHECDWDGITCRGKNIALIDLSESNLSGTIPPQMKSLSSLEAVNLFRNSIVGSIPDGLFDSLGLLAWLDLSQNRISGTIPQESTTSSVETILLRGNQLEGTVPFFPNIQKIHVESNRLTAIDSRYTTSAQFMTDFVGYDNRFSGPLPSVWNAPNVEVIDIGLNNWTGPIPQGLWDLTSLRSLIIDNCQLSGSLPSSTAGTAFQHVWLHSNQLGGIIPLTFGTTWEQLNSLLLQDNLLIGSITTDHCDKWPASTRDGTSDDWRCETDCNRTTMSCACCTQCYPT